MFFSSNQILILTEKHKKREQEQISAHNIDTDSSLASLLKWIEATRCGAFSSTILTRNCVPFFVPLHSWQCVDNLVWCPHQRPQPPLSSSTAKNISHIATVYCFTYRINNHNNKSKLIKWRRKKNEPLKY